ncbi:MAG TPA: rhodanese-like domain-containing protein [Gemmatimonadaceae bacterium]|nr:rhodanese-like domain-containing protein [Gemmatimonadaceae bacterium]
MNIRGERIGIAHVAVAAALLLALAAAFAGTPDRARNVRLDVESLARAVEHEDDHVTAIELAEWIRDRRPGLRVVDIRTSGEFDALHIPTAERIPLSDLSTTPFRRDETIVLYSEGGAHAGQGWVFLRALGYTQVYFLRGGLREWLDDVMSPVIAPAAGDSAKKAFVHVSDLSRYFGGSPHIGRTDTSGLGSRVPRPASRIPIPVGATKSSNAWARGC